MTTADARRRGVRIAGDSATGSQRTRPIALWPRGWCESASVRRRPRAVAAAHRQRCPPVAALRHAAHRQPRSRGVLPIGSAPRTTGWTWAVADPDPDRLRRWPRWSASSPASRSGRSRRSPNVFGPLTEFGRPIPAIALVPVAILLFPTDEAGHRVHHVPRRVLPDHGQHPARRARPADDLGGFGAHAWRQQLGCAAAASCYPAACPACSAGCRSAWASRGSV